MKIVIQVILIIWFVIINLFILIPSFNLLAEYNESNDQGLPDAPTPPSPLVVSELDTSKTAISVDNQIKNRTQQVNAYTQRVTAYTQQVAAYTQQMTAYKMKVEHSKKESLVTRFTPVVKDTISPLLTAFITAIVGFAFVNAGAGLVNNFIRAKNNEPIEPINFW